jgi:hypothetical protein
MEGVGINKSPKSARTNMKWREYISTNHQFVMIGRIIPCYEIMFHNALFALMTSVTKIQ